jgi:hypothetical protein
MATLECQVMARLLAIVALWRTPDRLIHDYRGARALRLCEELTEAAVGAGPLRRQAVYGAVAEVQQIVPTIDGAWADAILERLEFHLGPRRGNVYDIGSFALARLARTE